MKKPVQTCTPAGRVSQEFGAVCLEQPVPVCGLFDFRWSVLGPLVFTSQTVVQIPPRVLRTSYMVLKRILVSTSSVKVIKEDNIGMPLLNETHYRGFINVFFFVWEVVNCLLFRNGQ